MAGQEKCYLLAIPRELRNMIYDNIKTINTISRPQNGQISATSLPHERIQLVGTVVHAMLLVNRQIHDEYREYTLDRSCLMIDTRDSHTMHETLQLKASFPVEILRRVKRCSIFISWIHLDHGEDRGRTRQWCRDLVYQPKSIESANEWTPSKALVARLKSYFSILKSKIAHTARIGLMVSLDGYPDPMDLRPTGVIRFGVGSNPQNAWRASRIFEADTIASMSAEHTIEWPQRGKLSIGFHMDTALSCTVEDREKAKKPGQILDLSMAGTKPFARWRLIPTRDKNNYRGFFPVLLGIKEQRSSQQEFE